MRIDLEVPYSEKDQAKSMGARWDGIKKCWYIKDKESLDPFMQWMPSYLTAPHNSSLAKGKKEKCMKLFEYLKKRNGSGNAISKLEARILGISYPLQKGWLADHALMDISDAMLRRLEAARHSKRKSN